MRQRERYGPRLQWLAFIYACCFSFTLASCQDRASIVFIGQPGPVPHHKHLRVDEYGAFSYASPANYCHMTRWIISYSVLPEYAHEQKPTIIKRGTRAIDHGQVFATCVLRKMRFPVFDHALTKVELLDGKYKGQTRYVWPDDVVSEATYRDYAAREIQSKKAYAAYRRHHREPVVGKTYSAHLAVILDKDVFGPPIVASLEADCRANKIMSEARPTLDVPSFQQMRVWEPGYDEIRQWSHVRVIAGPKYVPCGPQEASWLVEVVGPSARAGARRGWMMESVIDF